MNYKFKLHRCDGILGTFVSTPYREKSFYTECKEKEAGKEPDMDTRSDAYRYVRNEAAYAEHEAYDKLRLKFKMKENVPHGGKELVNRILAGQYQLPKEDDHNYHEYGLIWRAPGEEPDCDGFNAAEKALIVEKKKVHDAAVLLEPQQALDALIAFRAYVDAL